MVDGPNMYNYVKGDPVNNWDPMGTYTVPGMFNEFMRMYGNDKEVLAAAVTVLSYYKLDDSYHGGIWSQDFKVDHEKKILRISQDDNYFGTRSDTNAAEQLHQIIRDKFGREFGLGRSWGGIAGDAVEGSLKTVGAGFSIAGGGALLAVPEPTLLTKVGGGGAIAFGWSLGTEGLTQIAGAGPEGGFNPIIEAAGAYGNAVGGAEGEKLARGGFGVASFAFNMAGALGSTKFANAPITQLPAATKEGLANAYSRLRGLLSKSPKDAPFAYGTPFRQLGRRTYRRLQNRVENRTITRDEWKRLQWFDRLTKRRTEGISSFWALERSKLQQGLFGTRNWNPAARTAILEGRQPVGIASHHKFSVSQYPQLANRPSNIYPVTFYEHFFRWHNGNWRNPTHGVPLNASIPEF